MASYMHAKRWCFTLRNYTDDETARIQRWLTESPGLCVYAIVGRETGPRTATPHLQGFVHFHGQKYLKGLKKILSPRAHLEIARGNDEANKKYCEKQGDVLLEVGEPAADSGTNASYLVVKELADKVARGPDDLQTLLDSDERYVRAYAKHSTAFEQLTRLKRDALGRDDFVRENACENLVMFKWQCQLYSLLTSTQPDKRQILWYVDTLGGAGKSTFVNYFLCKHPTTAVCFSGGKLNDLSYAYNRETVVFFDLCRSGAHDYLYGFMEQLKNGRLFSTKYQSGFKLFSRPHVVVFANIYPPFGAFSQDRLDVFRISRNEILKIRYGRQ